MKIKYVGIEGTERFTRDLQGMIFGRWTAVALITPQTTTNPRWLCVCDCGRQRDVLASCLLSGNSTSCSFCGTKRAKRREVIDLTGMRFGKLVVVSKAGGLSSETRWHCLCDCGSETVKSGRHMRSGAVSSCGCLRKYAEGVAAGNSVYTAYSVKCKKMGLELSLTKEQFRHLMDQNCHYCGREPSNLVSIPTMNGTCRYNGIDRVDSSIGYTVENCVPCCKMCNIAKNNHSVDDFIKWAMDVVKHQEHIGSRQAC